jgi:hypothetical protein
LTRFDALELATASLAVVAVAVQSDCMSLAHPGRKLDSCNCGAALQSRESRGKNYREEKAVNQQQQAHPRRLTVEFLLDCSTNRFLCPTAQRFFPLFSRFRIKKLQLFAARYLTQHAAYHEIPLFSLSFSLQRRRTKMFSAPSDRNVAMHLAL